MFSIQGQVVLKYKTANTHAMAEYDTEKDVPLKRTESETAFLNRLTLTINHHSINTYSINAKVFPRHLQTIN